MKKLLIKLGTATLISLILSANMALLAYAAGCDSTTIKEQLTGPECIKTGGSSGEEAEAGKKFITIMEEPLIKMEPKEFGGEAGTFEARTCYRVTVSCKDTKIQPVAALKETCAPSYEDPVVTCKEVTVIFSDAGTTMITGYVAMVYRWAAPIVGMICVLVIVISGLQLSFSGGDSGAVDSARKRIVQSLAGLAVLFLSSVILYTINPNFFTATVGG
ncbi:MAG: hypothetical protein WC269_03650 [Candidatus Gracilibacteria bacterium]|jgi:hypothetical protein